MNSDLVLVHNLIWTSVFHESEHNSDIAYSNAQSNLVRIDINICAITDRSSWERKILITRAHGLRPITDCIVGILGTKITVCLGIVRLNLATASPVGDDMIDLGLASTLGAVYPS